MCLALPGKILSVDRSAELPVGRVDFGGVERDIQLAYVPEAREGDYVLVHVGVAIQVLDAQRAVEILSTYGGDDGSA